MITKWSLIIKTSVVGLIKKLWINQEIETLEYRERERERRRDLKEQYEVYIGKTMRLLIIR